jgi:RNA polymerase primary sigma factor
MSMRQIKIYNSITTRELASLEKYLREIGKVELISPEEEVHFTSLIKEGDKKALNRLIKSNLRFVISAAKQYQGRGLALPDLINEGNIGFIKAAERFDDSRGFKFISFAVWWIRQSIMQAITVHARTIRLPLSKIFFNKQIQKTESVLEQELDRAPSIEEVAEALTIAPEAVVSGINMNYKTVNLDVLFSEEENRALLDTLENPNAAKTDGELNYTESLKKELDQSMQMLTDRQKETICYFFGLGLIVL